jgi:ribosome biogenesis SPOUT family RNA methylase Rps3
MIEKQIELIRHQIEKLDQKNFDLEAWKKHTIIILAGIFGDESQKVKQIDKLEYEYNSWSLRDTSGFTTYLDSCKKLGREILEASIEELQIMGGPVIGIEKPGSIEVSIILDALNDELKGSQYKALMKLLKSNLNTEEQSRQVHHIIKELDNETIVNILKGILIHTNFVKALG